MRRRFDHATVSRITTIALAMVVMAMAAQAMAAKVYRCGNVYQDRPCADDATRDARPADRASAKAAAPAERSAPAGPVRTPIADRLVVEPPRATTLEVRR